MNMDKRLFSFILVLGACFSLVSTAYAANGTSNNWAGYAARAATYTGVGATWNVPAASAPANTFLSSDATWVGIGGLTSADLIQLGTEDIIRNGSIRYEAWYELLPDDQASIPVSLHAGDSVSVSLVETSPDVWHLSFTNNTSGAQYEKDVSYHSSLSSAEWIEEMPVMAKGTAMAYIPLDNFGTVSFTGAFAIANGSRVTSAQALAQSITLLGRGALALAVPSALSGDTFSVARTSAQNDAAVRQFAINDMSVGRRLRHGAGMQRRVVIFISKRN